ncbi:hypothetical protein BKA03_001623 [Demequina lutea]|uniref:Uncharacterized protein n=1 Tax=Demequina lutea TaxID=431489 RepID=A0A7Z0CI46_9MICO|nr:hypothetical protein [Demequina lutea]
MTDTKKLTPHANEGPADEAKTWESSTSTLAPLDHERIERIRRIEADEQSRKASRELDDLIAEMERRPRTDNAPLAFSEALNRRTANDLASRGFDLGYLANLFGLPLTHRATALSRISDAA